MSEERIESTNEPVVENDNGNYIEAIKNLKENTVDVDKYNKLKEENRQLLETLVNGGSIDAESGEQPVDIEKLRDKIFNTDCSNLEYIDSALKLRNELIKNGEKDPFLPYGQQILPSDEDIEHAEKVAATLQDCVDIAEGNSDIFTRELQRRLIDPVLPRRK